MRAHWGIENSPHWALDVTFREDDSRIRRDHAPANFTTLRQFALNLIKRQPNLISAKQKRSKAALDDDFRAKVVYGLRWSFGSPETSPFLHLYIAAGGVIASKRVCVDGGAGLRLIGSWNLAGMRMKRSAKIGRVTWRRGLVLFVALWLWFALGLAFGQSTPARQRVEAAPVDPTSAAAILEASGASPNLPRLSSPTFSAASTASSPQIVALARALEADVDLIFQYVYEQIAYVPVYGSLKGATATLIEGQGNDFDQASLLIALLREAGHTANFVNGTLRVPPAELTSWLGLPPNPSVLGALLGSAGIPAQVFTYPDATLAFVDIDHVWVEVDIGGTLYSFDPSLKVHTQKPRVDLGAAMGYDKPTLLSNALDGATVVADYVQNINATNLHGTLAAYANNLASYVRANLPDGGLDDLIGGLSIAPLGATPIRDLAHPLLQAAGSTWVDIPNSHRTSLRVQHLGIDKTLFSDELGGKRLTLFYDSGTNQPTLFLDGAALATGGAAPPGTVQNLTLSVNHPYAANGGTYGDDSQALQILAGGSYIVVNGWGPTSERLVEHHRRILEANVHAEGVTVSEPVLGETLAVLAFSWLAETSRADALADRISDLQTIHHHTLGVSGQNQSPYIDMPMVLVSSISGSGDSASATSGFFNGSGHHSAFEWGVIDQLQPPHSAVCTVKVLDIANTQANKIFDADASNYYTTVKPQLVNYEAFEFASVEAYINAGYRVILPEDGDIGEASWSGIGFIAMTPSGTSIGHIIAGGLKGGFGTDPWTAGDMDTTPDSSSDDHEQSDEPIDLVTGNYLYEQTDLSVGSGDYPFSLQFRRHYNSANRFRLTPLGLGWSHNFEVQATAGSDGFEGMGRDSALDAVAAIVEQFVSADLLYGPKTATNVMIATMAHRWFMDRLIDNIVTISEPGNAGAYTLLADGSFNPPPGLASVLNQQPDTSYQLRTKHGIVLDFQVDGSIERWQDPNGNTVSFNYVTGVLESVSSSLGRTLSFSYTGNQLTQVSDGNGRSFTYAQDGVGNLVGATDASAETTTFEYDGDGLLARIYYPANPLAAFVSNVYDALGRVDTQTDGAGNEWSFYFAGARSKEVDPLGRARVFHFDDTGRMTREVDALGFATTYVYDGLQRLVRRTRPEGNSTEFTYDDRSNVISETIRPKTGSPALPSVWSYVFEPVWNRITTITNPLSRITTYGYDGAGNPVTISQPIVGATIPVTTLVYDGNGQVTSVSDPEGRVTSYAYDPLTGDLLSRTVDPGGLALVSQRVYDPVGNVIQEIDPRGNSIYFSYDAMRRLTGMSISPTVPLTEYAYDGNGNLSQIGRPSITVGAQVTTLGHSVTNKRSSILDPQGNTQSREFDELDRLWKETDALGQTTELLYDERGKLFQRVDAQQNTSEERTYTPNGREASLRDANGNLTLFVYDDFDRLESKIYEDLSTESFLYDAMGNLTQRTTRASETLSYIYDELDRLEQKTTPGPNTTNYSYDLAGKLVDVTDAMGTTHHVWDRAGRMSSVTRPDAKQVSYQYDANDNRTRVTHPDGFFVEYEYDELNRLIEVRDSTNSPYAAFSYGLPGDFDYALSRRVSDSRGADVVTTSYGREIDDDLTSVQHVWNGGSVHLAYEYDAVHKEVSSDVDDASFLFDAATDASTSYVPNTLNQYETVAGTAYSYDGNGNLASDGANVYVHDAENRLVQANNVSHVASYAYDAFARRAEKTVDGVTTRYVYDGNRVLEEYDGAGLLLRRFVYGPGIDEPVAMLTPGGTYYYVYDKLGSVIALTDETGALVEQHAYSPYGRVDAPSGVGNPYLFAGRRHDSETGLYHYRSRNYDAGLGRFLEVDPARQVGGMNLYAYVQNDPLNFLDPFGLFRFGKRPLSGAPWIPGGSSNPVDNYFNTEISHEHGFFEDGSGENIGFGPDGRFSEDPSDKGYRYDDKYYDDALIREALGNIEDGDYSLLGWGDPKKNNCQDWADRLRDEYERLKREREQQGPDDAEKGK